MDIGVLSKVRLVKKYKTFDVGTYVKKEYDQIELLSEETAGEI